MSGFIEVTLYNGEKELVNVSAIRRIKCADEANKKHYESLTSSLGCINCKIELKSSKAHDVVDLFVQETYQELRGFVTE